MKTVESSAVFQPKQWAEKEAGKTIENRTQPELVPNQASKSNIVRGALMIVANERTYIQAIVKCEKHTVLLTERRGRSANLRLPVTRSKEQGWPLAYRSQRLHLVQAA